MRSMKKIVALSLVVLLLAGMLLNMASCGNAHEHSYVDEVVAPTCTENGYTKHTCECGDTYNDNETPAAHAMTQVLAKEPTCTEAGEVAYSVCSLCGFVDGEKTVIPATGHLYVTTYVYPTATSAGAKTSVCSVCNDTKHATIEALSASLPKASDVLADIIGKLSLAVELAEGSELSFVTDYTDENDEIHTIFVEIAEVAVDGSGETMTAHLTLKVGTADTADKSDAEYMEFSVFVNGEDVSIAVNDNTSSVNLSEMIYGAVAEMLGLGDYETLLESVYVSQQLVTLMPLVTKALENMADGLPTISPEYQTHLEELIFVLGGDIVTETADANGNTVYSINPVALKALLEGFEDKTVAAYLEGVFGENVVDELANFLTSMPDKTVKEIVNAAVTFAEGTGVALEDVYTIIDLYVYFATNVEFSIEAEIADRYNSTLAELIAEMGGVGEAEMGGFVEDMKESFANAAETMKTITMDALFSQMIGADEGFLEQLAASIDMLDEAVTLEVTMNANGEIVAINTVIAGAEFNYEMDGDELVLNIVTPYGAEMSVTANENGFAIAVKQNGEVVATGSLTVTEETVGDTTTVTVMADAKDAVNDLLDYEIVVVNGVIAEATVVMRGYEIESEKEWDPEAEEWVWITTRTFVEGLKVEYNAPANGDTTLKFTADDVVTMITLTDDGIYLVGTKGGEVKATGSLTVTEETVGDTTTVTVMADVEDAENDLLDFKLVFKNDTLVLADIVIRGYEEEKISVSDKDDATSVINFVVLAEIYYDDMGDDGIELEIVADDSVMTFTMKDDTITVISKVDDEVVATVLLQSTETGLICVIEDDQNTLFRFELELNEDYTEVENAYLEINSYNTYFDENDEYVKEFVELVQVGYELIENEDGVYAAKFEYMGMVFVLNYELTDNGVQIAVTDEEGETTFSSFAVVADDETVSVDVFASMFGQTMIDVTVTATAGDGEVTLGIDLDKLLMGADSTYESYITLDGAVTLNVA